VTGDSVPVVPTPDAELPVAVRVQILATEHWSLLATRSLSWTESFSRAGMFLASLSAAVVALALVAQATAFGGGFVVFALVVLPFVLFIGLATHARLVAANVEELLWVQGMNRLRHAYLELAPELSPYFITSPHDDPRGVMLSIGARPAATNPVPSILHAFVTTPGMIAVINAMVGGVIAALATVEFGMGMSPGVLVGALALVALLVVQLAYELRSFDALARRAVARFPSPPDEPSA
jgi:hypothetical protein